jgi:ubiquinone/menaquinone biosynthesis C-methylase UbiE
MPGDKSLFYYGALYHRLFDAFLAEVRRAALDLVGQGSSVLDLRCGTGELCFELREKKHCQTVGVDLSVRMPEFARRSGRSADVSFLHMDAADRGN